MPDPSINRNCGVIPPTIIFKFQRPLYQVGAVPGEPEVLVYDESRQIEGMIPLTDELRELFGNGFKFYAACFINGDGTLSIRKVVDDQPW